MWGPSGAWHLESVTNLPHISLSKEPLHLLDDCIGFHLASTSYRYRSEHNPYRGRGGSPTQKRLRCAANRRISAHQICVRLHACAAVRAEGL